MKKAIVLLSGGLDSATCLYWAKSKKYKTFALIFDYGQRHRRELESALKLCRVSKTPHEVVRFALPWGGSSFIGRGGEGAKLPNRRSPSAMAGNGIPSTYVPARNTIFLSFALSYADVVNADAVVIGANAIDYSGYPDCRPDYLKAMGRVARLGTRRGDSGKTIDILSPLVHRTKAQIIRMGAELNVPYRWTWSCYKGGRKPCGECDSCILRAKGFEDARRIDPILN